MLVESIVRKTLGLKRHCVKTAIQTLQTAIGDLAGSDWTLMSVQADR